MKTISPIPPGDYDPNCEPDPECQTCSDILITDFFGELFCPTCTLREQKEAADE